MATELGKAYVQIVPSADGISGSITKALKGEASSAGQSAGLNIAGKLKGVIAAAGIGEVLKTALFQGAELQQNLGGTEAVFGKFAKNIQSTAQNAYINMGLSASEYMATANKMGSLFQGSGLNVEKSMNMTADAMQRASDVASVMGIDTSMAMESIAGAAKGNFTMMDNLGVAMNATTLEAYALEKGMNFKWNTASNAEKAELAMKMFMDRTAKYAGNYRNEVDGTLSGSLEALKASANDLLANVTMRPELVQNSLKNLISATRTFLIGNLVPALGNVLQSIPVVLGSFMKGNFVGTFMEGLAGLSGKLLEFSGTFISSGLDLVERLAEGIAMGLPMFIQNAPVIVGNLANIINQNAPKILKSGIKIALTLAKGIIASIPTLIASVPRIISALTKVWSGFSWGGLGKLALAGIKKGISAATSLVTAPIRSLVNRIKGFFPVSVGKIFSNLRIPKINISGGKAPFGIGGLGSAPKINVSWNAKGGIFDSASIIGYGVGEAGKEAILPLDPFWNKLDAMAEAISNGNGAAGVVEIYLDGSVIAKSTVNYINGQVQRYGTSPLTV